MFFISFLFSILWRFPRSLTISAVCNLLRVAISSVFYDLSRLFLDDYYLWSVVFRICFFLSPSPFFSLHFSYSTNPLLSSLIFSNLSCFPSSSSFIHLPRLPQLNPPNLRPGSTLVLQHSYPSLCLSHLPFPNSKNLRYSFPSHSFFSHQLLPPCFSDFFPFAISLGPTLRWVV